MSFVSILSAQAKLEDELGEARSELGELQGEVRSREVLIKDADRLLGEVEGRIEAHRRVLEEARVVLERIMEYEAKLRALDNIQALYDE